MINSLSFAKNKDVEMKVFKDLSSSTTLKVKNSAKIRFDVNIPSVKVVAEQIQNFVASIVKSEGRCIETLEGKYEGETENGLPCGQGTVTVDTGTFSGIFKGGLPNGAGVMETYSHKIEAFFVNGLPHGHGRAECCDIEKMMAFVKDGYLDVNLVMKLPKYMLYEGEYQHGLRIGMGRLTCENGDTYEGEFLDNKAHGKGKYTWPTGNVYEGDIKNNTKHGRGIMSSSSGDSYEGEWENDLPHGRGKSIFSDGTVYEGEMKNGRRHGTGTCQYIIDGKSAIYKGEWLDDKQHGQGTFIYSEGDTYTGGWKNGLRHGRGTTKRAGYMGYDYDGIETMHGGYVYKQIWKDGEVDSWDVRNCTLS